MSTALDSPAAGAAPARPLLGVFEAATLLALLLGLQPVLTDMYLPALPLIAQSLAAPKSAVQQTMSALILALASSVSTPDLILFVAKCAISCPASTAQRLNVVAAR